MRALLNELLKLVVSGRRENLRIRITQRQRPNLRRLPDAFVSIQRPRALGQKRKNGIIQRARSIVTCHQLFQEPVEHAGQL
eukprot:7198885-Pyramimonas_sp.AAC.1